jgi:hypothetical protein
MMLIEHYTVLALLAAVPSWSVVETSSHTLLRVEKSCSDELLLQPFIGCIHISHGHWFPP